MTLIPGSKFEINITLMKTKRLVHSLVFLFFFLHFTVLGQLQATLQGGDHCQGDAVIVPVWVENFDSVAEFQLKISYSIDKFYCEGYNSVNPQMANNFWCMIDQANGLITLQWQDTDPVTIQGKATLFELVFTPKSACQDSLKWITGTGGSYFNNINGEAIDAVFINGGLNVYEPPEVTLPGSMTVQTGDAVTITAIISSSHPPVSYFWTWPNGQTSTTDPYFASVTLADGGDYTLMASNAVSCSKVKTIHLEVVTSQGIDIITSPGFEVFPNPSSGLSLIRLPVAVAGKALMKAYDAKGQMVYEKEIRAISTGAPIEIDLSGHNNGLYFIEINLSDRTFHGKLILQNP